MAAKLEPASRRRPRHSPRWFGIRSLPDRECQEARHAGWCLRPTTPAPFRSRAPSRACAGPRSAGTATSAGGAFWRPLTIVTWTAYRAQAIKPPPDRMARMAEHDSSGRPDPGPQPTAFAALAGRWRQDTAAYSSIGRKTAHPDYQKIIQLGEPAIKFILKEMESEAHPSHWFPALKAITGADPVEPEHRGDMLMMKQSWIRWGKDNRMW